EAQGDPLLLLVDAEDDGPNRLALLEDFRRVADLLGPRQVADVQKPVDAFFDLDERAVVGDVADLALDDRARRILLGHALPGVLLDLLHAERDFLLVLVDLQHLHLHALILRDHFAGVIDALGPGHLGDVDQAFDAFLELAERAVRHDVDDAGLVDRADRILLLDVLPGAGFLLLEAQGDLFLVLVYGEDLDLDLLVDLEHVAGVVDAAPGHVGDVQEAVDAAQVDERTEVGDVLDRALDNLPGLNAIEGLALELLALLLDELAAGDDDVAAFLVDLQDDRVDRAANPVGNLAWPADVHLAGRQEHRHADVHQQPALDLLGDLARNRVPLALGLHDRFPVDDAICLALGDFHEPGVALDVFKEDADFVADVDVLGFVKLAAFENAFALEAELDDKVVACHAADPALEDGAGGEILDLVALDHLGQIQLGAAVFVG